MVGVQEYQPILCPGIFLYLLETLENPRFSAVFREYRNSPMISNGLVRLTKQSANKQSPGDLLNVLLRSIYVLCPGDVFGTHLHLRYYLRFWIHLCCWYHPIFLNITLTFSSNRIPSITFRTKTSKTTNDVLTSEGTDKWGVAFVDIFTVLPIIWQLETFWTRALISALQVVAAEGT